MMTIVLSRVQRKKAFHERVITTVATLLTEESPDTTTKAPFRKPETINCSAVQEGCRTTLTQSSRHRT